MKGKAKKIRDYTSGLLARCLFVVGLVLIIVLASPAILVLILITYATSHKKDNRNITLCEEVLIDEIINDESLKDAKGDMFWENLGNGEKLMFSEGKYYIRKEKILILEDFRIKYTYKRLE